MNDLEQMRRHLSSLGGYSETVAGDCRRITLTAPYRVAPTPESARRLIEDPQSLTWEADEAIRTRLVFGANGKLLAQKSTFNTPRG